ncbi:hypothetical protein [Aquipseudomonas campi]
MHADGDDSPFKSRKQSDTLNWMVALGIGTSLTLGMLFVASMNAGKDKLKNAFEIATSKPIAVEQPKAEKKPEVDWDRVVEEQAKRDAANDPGILTRPIVREAEKRRRQAEDERKANAAIAVLSAPKFGDGVKGEPQKGKQTIVVIGKQESKISDFCPGGEGSITRRNCKQRTNLSTRF